MVWTANCETAFGRTPQPNQCSIKELEELLNLVGDEEVKGIRAGTETLYDGTVAKFIADKSKPYGDALACFIECPDFESQVYAYFFLTPS